MPAPTVAPTPSAVSCQTPNVLWSGVPNVPASNVFLMNTRRTSHTLASLEGDEEPARRLKTEAPVFSPPDRIGGDDRLTELRMHAQDGMPTAVQEVDR